MANFLPLEQDGALAAVISAAIVALKAAGDRALSAYRTRRENITLESTGVVASQPASPLPTVLPQAPQLSQPTLQPVSSNRAELQALFQLIVPVEDAVRAIKRSSESFDNNGVAQLAEVANRLAALVSALNLNRLRLTVAASGLVDQLAGRYADIARVYSEVMELLKSGSDAGEPASSFLRQLSDALPDLSSLRKQIESDFRSSGNGS